MPDFKIQCGDHGPQLGYIICVHVMDNHAQPVDVLRARPEDLGEIVCRNCRQHPPEEHMWDFRLCCERCAIIHGHISASGK